MRARHLVLSVLLVVAWASAGWGAPQETTALAGTSAQGNHLITFKGVLKDADGNPRPGVATVTFRLYAAQEGGEPLWRETQTVQADAAGRYSVFLGSSMATGLPAEAFGDGKAQWLAAQVDGEAEQPRVLLVAVPYALKAADADTLGGKPVAAFVLTDNLAKAIQEHVATTGAAVPVAAGSDGTIGPLGNETGTNTWYGELAAQAGGGGWYNSFFGYSAGQSTTPEGVQNAFFGCNSGRANTTGYANTFMGNASGAYNQTGRYNTAIGHLAGHSNVSGDNNTFLGSDAGAWTTGSHNTFVGGDSGEDNQQGQANAGFGRSAGASNTTGSFNVFVGHGAGLSNTTESGNTFLGGNSNGSAGIANATAIGFLAQVTATNSIVLGSIYGVNDATASTNVGIGTTAPVARLQVEGGEFRLLNGDGWYSHLNYWNTGVNYIRGATYFDSAPVYFTGGNVGVGTGRPVARLQVEGGELRLLNGDGWYSHLNYWNTGVNYIRGTTYFDTAPVYFTGGNIGIGITSAAHPLQLASGAHVTAGGVWTNASSRTFKQDIAALPLEQALAAVDQLAPVTYEYKASPGERHVGFIAEDVPDLVATGDRKSLSPMDIVAVLTKVVQAQEQRLQVQESRIAELERQLGSRRR